MQLTRLEFLASLLGLGVGARALAQSNPDLLPPVIDPAVMPVTVIPEPSRPQLIAFEFLRLFKEQVHPLVSEPLPLQSKANWRQYAGITLEVCSRDLYYPLDQFAQLVIAPSAASMAAHVLNQQERGARGFFCCRPPEVPCGPMECKSVIDEETGLAARYLCAYFRDDQMHVRFDMLYTWRLRPRQIRLRFDPLRLPA